MRLTNIAQMDVEAGDLFTCVAAFQPAQTAEEAELPISFDQARHMGFGSRAGSWMAVSCTLDVGADLETIAVAWEEVIARHGTLRSVFSCASPRATSAMEPHRGQDSCSTGPDVEAASAPASCLKLTSLMLTGSSWQRLGRRLEADQVRGRIRALFDEACDPFASPSHRLCVVQPQSTARPQVIIGADHTHVDAWSLLVLVRDLLACVEDVKARREPGVYLPDALDFEEHTAELKARDPAPERIEERWREILTAGGGDMPQFPLPLGDLRIPVPEVVEVRDVLDGQELLRLESYAAAAEVRLIAVAVSVMTRLAQQLAQQPLRTVFPVHSRFDRRWQDSVGWFITNSVLENDDESVASSHAAVSEAAALGSYALEPIMAKYGGMPQSPGMFAMSWLDHRKLPISVPESASAQHVSAVIRTDGVMIWFVVNESGLHLRCRYPDTAEACSSMRTWLAGLVYGMRAPLVTGQLH